MKDTNAATVGPIDTWTHDLKRQQAQDVRSILADGWFTEAEMTQLWNEVAALAKEGKYRVREAPKGRGFGNPRGRPPRYTPAERAERHKARQLTYRRQRALLKLLRAEYSRPGAANRRLDEGIVHYVAPQERGGGLSPLAWDYIRVCHPKLYTESCKSGLDTVVYNPPPEWKELP